MADKKINKISNYNFYALIVTAGAFVLRLAGACFYWVGGDEGNFLYDALMWNKGLVPFKDFLLGSPGYIFLMKFTIKIFGRQLIAGRIITVVLATATVYLIYLIGKRLWNEKVGLASAIIFAVAPFSIFYGSMIKTEPNVSFFAAFAFYLAIVAYQDEKLWPYITSGLLLGIAACFRLSSFVFEFTLIVFLGYFYILKNRQIMKFFIGSGLLVIGFIFPYALLTFYLSMGSSIKEVINGWSPAVVSVRHNKGISNILSVKVSEITSWIYKVTVDAGYYLIFAITFIGIQLKRFIKKPYGAGVGHILLFLYAALILRKTMVAFGSVRYAVALLFLVILLIIPAFYLINVIDEKKDESTDSLLFLSLWFGVLMISYVFYHLEPMYFYELSLPVAIGGGYVLVRALEQRKSIPYFGILAVTLSLWLVLPHVYYQQMHGFSRYWSSGELKVISQYLDEQGIGKNKEDVFFTANTVTLFNNDLKSFGNMSHGAIYLGEDQMTDEKLKSFHSPTVAGIVSGLKSGGVKYVLMDKRTRKIFLKYRNIIEAIDANYHRKKVITGDVILYEHN